LYREIKLLRAIVGAFSFPGCGKPAQISSLPENCLLCCRHKIAEQEQRLSVGIDDELSIKGGVSVGLNKESRDFTTNILVSSS